jgi:hypothetical protein
MSTSAVAQLSESENICVPSVRDKIYGRSRDQLDLAKYLLDLHNSKAVFNFCGSLLFQLSLTPRLQLHLTAVANAQSGTSQPVIYDATKDRLALTPGYRRTADADNVHVFHGREIRKVKTAAGGMRCILQLSLANDDDSEGWTNAEIADYNGWAHDGGRPWRRGQQLEREGFAEFTNLFGTEAYALHHRFYFHLDGRQQIWLAAEDGCEGEPVAIRQG